MFVVSVVFMTVSFLWLRGDSSLSSFLLFSVLILQLLSIYCFFSFIWPCLDSITYLLSFSMYSHMQPQLSSGKVVAPEATCISAAQTIYAG